MSDESNIVNRTTWLLGHIQSLLDDDNPGEASSYLNRLLEVSDDPLHRAFCLKHLGRIALKSGDLDTATAYLRQAVVIETSSADVRFEIGELARDLGVWWLALVNYLEAIHRSKDSEDIIRFMQSAAIAFEKLEFGEVALSVLLGALERKPDDVFILGALEHLYETSEQWIKAREITEALLDLVSPEHRLEDDSRRRLDEISQKMRNQIVLVGEDAIAPQTPDGTLAPTSFPSGLHTLVHTLGLRDRNLPLLTSAQVLWAKAKHDQFDTYLSTPTMAAAIHWIVERLHWRIPTSVEDLETIYNVQSEQLLASVRLIVGRFQVEIFPTEEARAQLPPDALNRLRKIQRAVLFGVDLDELDAEGVLG